MFDTLLNTMLKKNKGALFGEDVAMLLKTRKPVVVTRVTSKGHDAEKNYSKFLKKIMGIDTVGIERYKDNLSKIDTTDKVIVDLRNSVGLNLGIDSAKNSLTPNIIENFDKFKESEIFSGYIPKSIDLQKVTEVGSDPTAPPNIAKLRKYLKKNGGEHNWVIKRKNSDGRFEDSIIHPWRLEAAGKYPTNELFLQEYKNLVPNKEYRVHVYKGKVVPFATFKKSHGGLLTSAPGLFQTEDLRRAESFVQEIVDKLPANYKKNSFAGFDVAFEKGTNNTVMIESNILERKTGTSGFLDYPQVVDAVISAAQGKLPKHIIAGRALLGLGALGVTGGTVYGTKKLMEKKGELELSDKQKKWLIGGSIGAASLAILPLPLSKALPALANYEKGVKGYLNAAKKMYIDAPKLTVQGKKLNRLIGLPDNFAELKLFPTKIREISNAKRGFTEHTLESYVTSRDLDALSTQKLIKELEDAARKEGKDAMIGLGHFSPDMAAAMGYTPYVGINVNLQKKFSTHLYEGAKRSVIKQIKKDGHYKNLGPTDAYILAADPTASRFYIKDLTVTDVVARERALDNLKNIPLQERAAKKEQEKKFTEELDTIMRMVYNGR